MMGNNSRVIVRQGDTVVCTVSKSCAYTQGGRYKVYADDKGQAYLIGDDGFVDLWSNLVSSFSKVEK